MRGGSCADSESVITLTHTSPISCCSNFLSGCCTATYLSVCLLGLSVGGGVTGTGEAEGGAEQHPEAQ